MVEVDAGQPPAVAGHEKSGCGRRGGGKSVFSAEEDGTDAAAPETGFRFAGVEVLGQAQVDPSIGIDVAGDGAKAGRELGLGGQRAEAKPRFPG